METILLTIQIIIAILLVGIILLQPSSNDGLSGLSSSNNNNNLLSGRAASSIITKMTYIFAIIFMINSLALANLANKSRDDKSIIDMNYEEDKNTAPLIK